MKNIIFVIVIGILTATALPMAATAQDGASIFVVYGTMYEEDGVTPVNDDYLITVEIPLKGTISTLTLGENDGPGRFSVLWIDYEGGLVVEEGDQIVVKADKDGELTFGCYYTVKIDDIAANKVMLDIQRGVIAADNKTWGAIKSMYK
jgi:hypothetical protein